MKDPFVQLDDDFKASVNSMDEAEIRNTIAKVALDQAALQEAKEQDTDLAEKKEIAREAGTIYRDGTKHNKIKILYCRQALGDKSKENGSVETE
jgi:hypothetical protein